MPSASALRVVIAGGGVAALGALLALRDLAGDLVEIALVAPEEKFSYRPLSVAQPFSLGHPTHYPLDELADELGAHLVPDTVAEVAANAKVVHCGGGITVPYDALILALGAQASRAYPTGTSFAGGDDAQEAVHGLLADLEQGYGRRVAFVAPTAVAWTLPLYELAIMTARELWSMGMDGVRFTLVTPEPRPLAAFGPIASAAIADLLERERIGFEGSAYADVRDGSIVLGPDGRRLEVDRVVSLPRLSGPGLPGVPHDADGFIPVDPHGGVLRLADVYAAGDVTDFPIKQGGLATQQADAVAEAIAARAGAPVVPAPFRPVLRGVLMTGGPARFMSRDIAGGDGDGTFAAQSLWWPPTKIAGRYLAPYLYGRDEAELVRAGHAGHTAIDVALER